MRLSIIISISSLFMFAIAWPARPGEPAAAASRVQVNQDHFVIPEAKASFTIPQKWLNYSRFFKVNSVQLATLNKPATHEWDSTYGPVVDAVLPLADCLLHIGNDGWDSEAVVWSDVQMRAYLTDTKPDDLKKSLETKGTQAAVASKGMAGVRGRGVIKTDLQDEGPWKVNRISFDLWYGDYGGNANVFFYSRPSGAKTLVLVFMMVEGDSPLSKDAAKDREAILKSFEMEK